MKKTDLIIFFSALALFGTLWLILSLRHTAGSEVVVSVDGVETAVYPLDTDLTVEINGYDGGSNTLVISDHQAKITWADCPDHSCVHQKAVSADTETIVCLPHRVVVTVRSGEENGIDALTR
ncbi:MAG: NusG domain II-containing protein [Lachnospiraceae bacterium]|nr:NusG domain II-containing protein [Lachnospiraceae bacterium]